VTETKRLGRGLEALLGPLTRETSQAGGGLKDLPVSTIGPNPYQPRRQFEEAQLQELADSIEASGLLQPVVVRPQPNAAGRYELIAGERRWRAVQRLGWKTLPAVVKEVDDRSLLTLALIENLQRDALSPLDAARGYQQLMQEFTLPQHEVARLVGKDRSTVSNTLRLLRLPEEVQQLVEARRLSEGHARALLALSDPPELIRLARECAAAEWSVRSSGARRATANRRAGSQSPPPAAGGSPQPERRRPAGRGCLAQAIADGRSHYRPPPGARGGDHPLLLQRRSGPVARADPG
jgi:ParB family transcriptional regulator, chromosome partitioning protein